MRINIAKDKNKKAEDIPLDKTFEATTIFQVLLNLNTDTFNVVEGRQEDAEEFLVRFKTKDELKIKKLYLLITKKIFRLFYSMD